MAKKYALPDMEHTFKIQIEGNESKINWAGEFKYRRPSLGTRGQIDVMRCKLNQDLRSIDQETNLIHTALAHLRFTLHATPEWWQESDYGGDLMDANVVTEIYSKCMDFERDWAKKVHGGEPEEVEDGNESKKKNWTKRSVKQSG
jgi:hypothetical protein